MSVPVHTYGSTCLRSTRKDDYSKFLSSPTPPTVQAQFFYASSLPIDDTLTPHPTPSTGSYTSLPKSLQPFSAQDNFALEEAWKTLRETRKKKPCHESLRIIDGSRPSSHRPISKPNLNDPIQIVTIHSKVSISGERDTSSPASSVDIEQNHASSKRRQLDSVDQKGKAARYRNASSPSGDLTPAEVEEPSSVGPSESNLSRSPFIRAPPKSSESLRPRVRPRSPKADDNLASTPQSNIERDSFRGNRDFGDTTVDAKSDDGNFERHSIPEFNVTVGTSRLHTVELPNLKVCIQILCQV